jgi:hypothetical protein
VAAPDMSRHSISNERHHGQTGRGGCRSRPHAAQAWIRSSPVAVARQNGAATSSSVSGRRNCGSVIL